MDHNRIILEDLEHSSSQNCVPFQSAKTRQKGHVTIELVRDATFNLEEGLRRVISERKHKTSFQLQCLETALHQR